MLYYYFSSCNIIGTLCVITFGGATVVVNLGVDTVIGTLGGAIIATSLGTSFVWGFYGCMLLNNASNILMVYYWLSPVVKGFFVLDSSLFVSVPWIPWWLAPLLTILT